MKSGALLLAISILAYTLLIEAFVARKSPAFERQCPNKSRGLMATSSSDLKSGKKRKRNSVVSRLAKAAKEANSKYNAKKRRERDMASSTSHEEDEDHLSSISNLSQTIDDELLHPRDGYRPPLEFSSMRVLLEHNDRTMEAKNPREHVAVVFSKPLCQDQITIEYATRLVSLARAMKYEDYQPTLICFCGSTQPRKGNLVSETSAGVIFFRHLCTANQISLENTDLRIIQQTNTDSSWSPSSLNPVVDELFNRNDLEVWLDKSQVYESKKDEYGLLRREPRKKIHIHWTLISTDYHLCNLNDIHVRSPRQSPLHTLLHELDQAVRTYRGIVKTTWSFRYSTYPHVYSKDELTAFLCKCYLMAQELRPLLVNLRGVATGDEFFQRYNYRALVATRRSLVTLMEETNEAFRDNKQRETATASVPPNLKAQLQKTVIASDSKDEKSKVRHKSTDVALESALVSLGRCMDLVRPAGTLSSKSVPREDWKSALKQLEYFLDLMQRACDPDRPLPANEWGKLSVENVEINTMSVVVQEEPIKNQT